ncbi:hypothetical protein [Actinoplanes sp. NPDC026623]|uniref:hypothetical protein n=1 Tax=Actinoplanes sp. NPDC026623 TaxID=3155610 RepID=UPI0033E5D00A
MEGNRRYAEEPDPSWYTGQRPPDAASANAYDSGVYERPSSAYRLPEQRPADPYSAPAGYPSADPAISGSHALSSSDSGSIRIPVRGPEYPAVRPGGAAPIADPPAASATTYGSGAGLDGPSASAAYNEPTSMVPMTGGAGRPGPAESVYGGRRPVSAMVFALIVAVLSIPAVMLLVRVTFVDDPSARGVVPAVLLTLGLPLTGLGLFSVAGGGGVGGRDAWLRAPVVYLPIGLVLLLAAGLGAA